MPLEIVTVPCLRDNYAFLVNGPDGVWLVDAPEAAPILAELDARGWHLDLILITHHHPDHHDGVAALRDRFACKVMGPAAEADRLPPLDRALADGDTVGTGAGQMVALAVPGHTLGHLAFHAPGAGAVFTADSLMALGCGRLFEGTPAQMWTSLQRFADMPDDTLVCSGHEYTEANARFALTIEPDNPALQARAAEIRALRAQGRPTVPSTLGKERATNPFLRADQPHMKQGLGMPDATNAEAFAEIRARKDRF